MNAIAVVEALGRLKVAKRRLGQAEAAVVEAEESLLRAIEDEGRPFDEPEP